MTGSPPFHPGFHARLAEMADAGRPPFRAAPADPGFVVIIDADGRMLTGEGELFFAEDADLILRLLEARPGAGSMQ